MQRTSSLMTLVVLCALGQAVASMAADPAVKTSEDRDTLLYVRTVPSGAKVLLDGKELGTSDGVFHVAPGVGTIVVELDGHKPNAKQVTIRADGVTRVDLKLKPKADGLSHIEPDVFTLEGHPKVTHEPSGKVTIQADKMTREAGAAPRIVSTSPAVGATDIAATTSEITITFDRDMAGGFSWTGGGPDFPPISEDKKPSWRDRRTAVLPVKLEAGHYYRVGINSDSFKNFCSTEGTPVRPSAIYFATQGASEETKQRTRVPQIVSLNPPNGAQDVDPGLRVLRVTFSMPMGDGMSWCGGGPNFPMMRQGKKATWTKDRKTCILPVELKPNWEYRLGLNAPSFKNFQSAGGVPLEPVEYTFKTRDAGDEEEAAAEPAVPDKADSRPKNAIANILANPGAEKGDNAPNDWEEGAAIEGVTYSWDKDVAVEGKASLCIEKTAQKYFPIAQWSQTVERTGDASVLDVSAQVKAEKMTKAILDVVFLDKDGQWISHKWAAYIGSKKNGHPPANHKWKKYSGNVEIPAGTAKLCIALQVYGPGKVWFDDVQAQYRTAKPGANAATDAGAGLELGGVVLDKARKATWKDLEMLVKAAEAAPKASTAHIVVRMRTPPQDNFSCIMPDCDFVPVEIWKQFGDQPKWRVEKPDRVARSMKR